MREEWRDVIGFEGIYRVSNLGRVRSLSRKIYYSDGRIRNHPGRVLKGSPDESGYPQVNLRKDRKPFKRRVHSLVAEAFFGPPPRGMEVRHLDGNPSNNRTENLAYGTSSQNKWDTSQMGRNWQQKKTHCPRGHPLQDPNLVPWGRGRDCWSCNNAKSLKGVRDGTLDLKEESDRIYKEKLQKENYD